MKLIKIFALLLICTTGVYCQITNNLKVVDIYKSASGEYVVIPWGTLCIESNYEIAKGITLDDEISLGYQNGVFNSEEIAQMVIHETSIFEKTDNSDYSQATLFMKLQKQFLYTITFDKSNKKLLAKKSESLFWNWNFSLGSLLMLFFGTGLCGLIIYAYHRDYTEYIKNTDIKKVQKNSMSLLIVQVGIFIIFCMIGVKEKFHIYWWLNAMLFALIGATICLIHSFISKISIK